MTGYTHELLDKDQSFEQFAMSCARYFGACVTIPEKFEPSDYYSKAHKDAVSELARLVAMDNKAILEYAGSKVVERARMYKEAIEKAKTTKAKLQSMREKVAAWTPPTSEHIDMKEFMLEQIDSTIKIDGNGDNWVKELKNLESVSLVEIHADAVKSVEEDIAYYSENKAAEEKRCAERTAWIKALRDSLNPVAV